MSSSQAYEGDSLYTFEGFTFKSHSENAMGNHQVQSALRSTKYTGAKYNAMTRALVNLAVLFKAMVYFMPYFSLPEFWEVVCDKWALMETYPVMRHLVHMCVFARGAFLGEEGIATRQAATPLADLSHLFASLVDTWRQVYSSKTYFDLREKAYEDPDENLRVQLGEAKVAWKTTVLHAFIEQVLELLPREQSTSHRHHILLSSAAQAFSPPGLPENTGSNLPLRKNTVNAMYVSDGDGDYNQTSPIKKTSPSVNSIDSEYVPDEELDGTPRHLATDMDLDETPGRPSKLLRRRHSRVIAVFNTASFNDDPTQKGITHKALDEDILPEQQPQGVNMQHPVRMHRTRKHPLFSTTSMKRSEDFTMRDKKGGMYGDAEDYTRMNGQPLISSFTLAGMIRNYMKKEKEGEMQQEKVTTNSTSDGC